MAGSTTSSASEVQDKAKPHPTLLRVGLTALKTHFSSQDAYIAPDILADFDLQILDRIKRDSAKQENVRIAVGTHKPSWEDLTSVLSVAVPSLSERCLTLKDDTVGAEADTQLIVQSWGTLVKDIPRLSEIVAIGRNVLTVGEEVQHLAAKEGFDKELCKLVTVCVKVSGRGFDIPGGSKDDERKWQHVVNEYKKLLMISLQFLNNLVAQNERRKLNLWVELFDSPADANYPGPTIERGALDSNGQALDGQSKLSPNLIDEDLQDGLPDVIRKFKDGLMAHLNRLDEQRPAGIISTQQPFLKNSQPKETPYLLFRGKAGAEIQKELLKQGRDVSPDAIAAECKLRWESMAEEQQQEWETYYHQLVERYRDQLADLPERDPYGVVDLAQSVEAIQANIRNFSISNLPLGSQDAENTKMADHPVNENVASNGTTRSSIIPENGPAVASDYRVVYTAEYGATILQRGKEDLLSRIEPDSSKPLRSRRTRRHSPPETVPAATNGEGSQVPDLPDAPLALPSEDERDLLSEEEDSEDEYPNPGDDGRGLLTDVPLILAPTEIEVLPMIIMSGIVPPRPDQEGYGTNEPEIKAVKDMHTVRCHLLLAQDNGRNLLRELLIFVAAWDLRDDELYFKLMMKIIEAVLTNGLLPFSYTAFKESKDIISPAQAVIMKLLTSIFRSRQAETARQRLMNNPQKPRNIPTPYPERNDVHMVSFLFTEFRRNIIPQTCALIYLQGQIRNGTVSPDEFPLNLWDMERMYEGIYQYLEFFAILTEHDIWKRMMADWEITSELVTLLEELDAAIPRSTPRHQPNYKQRAMDRPYGPQAVANEEHPATSLAVAVERPYDVNGQQAPPNTTAGATQSPSLAEPVQQQQQQQQPQPPYAPPPEDEPSDFEWRNLKKLAVLVLSSLVWKSPLVQTQLSHPSPLPNNNDNSSPGRGVRALLNCCKVDDYNPYIREHAIMALRFALEGCKANQDVVEGLQRLGVEEGYGGEKGVRIEVPREVLDLNGYETFVDRKGQVQLKKRVGDENLGVEGGSRFGT
ncbi:hypothetical protein EJ08DRAFT_690710 [Tothia fuscella]|uniref:Ataxin-10 homolog n=1 Tax=Tothia fuscella TaxID=1048955 RepID=A0A9P4NEX9_9PEZI|nr:hypothetical protein EJ08DRAFT_690710 [Tothia fuscella]